MTSKSPKTMQWLLIVVVITIVALFAYVWQPAIDPVQATTETYPQEQIKLGKDVAAAGACVVCHTADDQIPYTGGHPMETPFGTIYSTNITPDVETGIGAWSFEAFDRSMRKGVARDGHYLYPAFPYTHFTHMNDEEMQALYAYMMSLEPIEAYPPKTDLPFPFNIRPLMAGWNLLYLDKGPVKLVEDKSTLWNRGNYLVRSSGHCAACHSPRNSLGAEKKGNDYLAGGEAEVWIAPALNQDSPAPIAWTEDALYDYLRYGFASQHGAAGGSMAPVVREGTSQLPKDDVRAIATYLASFHSTNTTESTQVVDHGTKETDRSLKTLTPPQTQGARMFNSACMSCYHAGDGPTLFGVRPELWLSSTLYLDKSDNLIHFVLDGEQNPAHPDLGYMAPFRHSLSDEQIATLVKYAKEHPGELTYASFGIGTSAHIAGEMLKNAADIDLLHVPYKGGAPAMADLLGGRVDLMIQNLPDVLPHLKNGTLKAYGVTSLTRADLAPNIPSIAEQGYPDFTTNSWYGVLVPAGTDKTIITSLNAAINKGLEEKKEALAAMGVEVMPGTPSQQEELMDKDLALNAEIVKKANIRID